LGFSVFPALFTQLLTWEFGNGPPLSKLELDFIKPDYREHRPKFTANVWVMYNSTVTFKDRQWTRYILGKTDQIFLKAVNNGPAFFVGLLELASL